MKYRLDAMGTDGSDPTKVVRIYPDGRVVPLSQPPPAASGIEAAALEARDQRIDIDSVTTIAAVREALKNVFVRLMCIETELGRILNGDTGWSDDK